MSVSLNDCRTRGGGLTGKGWSAKQLRQARRSWERGAPPPETTAFREPVEDKYKSHLGHLSNRRNIPAIPPHSDQHRLSGHIVVPNIVVHHLEYHTSLRWQPRALPNSC